MSSGLLHIRGIDNKGMALIAAFSVYAILMVLTVTFLMMTDSELNISTNQRDTTKALYIGEGGLEYGIYKLLTDWNWTGTSGSGVSLGGGRFEVAVTELADSRKEVLATGICQQALAMGRVIESKRKIQVTMAPPAFKYAVMSTANVNLLPVSRSTGLVGSGDEGNVHSNTRVRTNNRVTVEGDITEQSPAVSIPDVYMKGYEDEARATDSFYTGTLNIRTINQGDFQGKVVYCTGMIRIRADNGPITLDGTTLVAEGNIAIQGDYGITISPNNGYPSLVTEDGDITGYFNVPDNSNLELLVFTKNGNINLINLMMDKGSVIAGAGGLSLTTTTNQKFRIIYDNTILTNKPKYFTIPVDTASLYWKEIY